MTERPGIIILEGPDGTGKTTLAKKLASKLNMKYVKIPRHKDDPELDGFKFYLRQAEQLPDGCVVDRFHIGECVYPLLYENDLRYPLKLWQQHAIERLLQARGCLLVSVQANYEFIERNYIDRNEHFYFPSIIKECDMFSESIFNSMLLTKTFITTHTNEDLFVDFVGRNIDIINKYVLPIQQYHSTGSVHHPVMIVGDSINKQYGTEYCFGACSGSSSYIHQALDIAGCKTNYYLTNALKDGNNYQQNIDAILQENYHISPIQIIALGRNANGLLNDAELPHVMIEHPAHHKRFHHNVYAYAHMFAEVIA